MSDYLYDKTGHDDEVAALERLLGGHAHAEPLRALPPRRSRRRAAVLAGGVLAAAAAIVVVVLAVRGSGDAPAIACAADGAGMAFAVERGTTRCGGDVVAAGTLPVGRWLETAPDAVATVEVARIGSLTVFGDSRLRLVETGAREHRLELAAGRITARVTAPPRLFVVDTPAATAVDLGCAYELVVDAAGRTHLTVTEGAVSLEGKAGVAWVPRNASVIAGPRGVGTPVGRDATPAVRAAVERLDAGDASSIRAALPHATGADIVTLWHLIARTTGDDRAAVVAALEELVPRPLDHPVAEMVASDPAALEAWREDVAWEWLLRD